MRMSADEGMAAERSSSRDNAAPAMDEAKQWLLDALRDGPRPAKELREQAEDDGIKEATLRRAKDGLHVIARRAGGMGGAGRWVWLLPGEPGEPDSADTPAPKALKGESMSALADDERLSVSEPETEIFETVESSESLRRSSPAFERLSSVNGHPAPDDDDWGEV